MSEILQHASEYDSTTETQNLQHLLISREKKSGLELGNRPRTTPYKYVHEPTFKPWSSSYLIRHSVACTVDTTLLQNKY
jgi:hypothetical protein